MTDEQFTPEEQELIRRLRTARKPRLAASTREAVRQQVLNEFRATRVSPARPSGTHRPSPRLFARVAAAFVATVVLLAAAVTIIQVRNHPAQDSNAQVTALPGASPTEVAPTATQTRPTESVVPPTAESPLASTAIPVTPGVTMTTPPPPITVMPTPTATATEETVIVVEGPITNIVNNIITIYGFDIEVEPQNPLLKIIDIDDVVHVEGALQDDGVLAATVVSNITSTTPVAGGTATVGLEGPVESISGNVITVNGIPVQLAPESPLLQTVQVGDFVSVQGNFVGSGSAIVLVVVNISIVNNIMIEGEPLCWYHDTGMGMGHWHCDGMGMGEAMGMGTAPPPPAMGMGE